MYAEVEKPKENKSRAVANSVGQKKNSDRQGMVFVDNRTEAKSQKSLQMMINNSALLVVLQKEKNIMQENVIQRDAYWRILGGMPATPFAQTTAPAIPFIRRVGGSRNHRLYSNASGAKNAAKSDLNLGGSEIRYSFKAFRGGNDAAAGSYTYYPNIAENKTKVLVNHNGDPNASLVTDTGVQTNPANHYHAGIINDRVVPRDTVKPTNIVYENIPRAAEHYFNM